ncbi:MAG: tetratricopeptide repeat protein [Candidatus Eisenbacteria sp.]|nr:tetratricopeptide repeat protein [Candidatus Eisenbacteria bacterium]
MLLVLVLGSVGPVLAQDSDPGQQVVLANEAYERGEYPQAIEIYRGILDGGLRSADLYYNLGNAYMKAGQLGWAVLNYERALRLNPRDADIQSNLEYTRARMVDVLPTRKPPWLLSVFLKAHNLIDLGRLLWITSGLWFAVVALAMLSLYQERFRRPTRIVNIVLAAVLAVALTSVAFKVYSREARRPGVVVADEVHVMSGPGDEYAREFVLHAGTRIEIKRSYQQWHEITLSDEMRGWVGRDAVQQI